jgi:hypothetical protein
MSFRKFLKTPQIEFKLPDLATVEYFPDLNQESVTVVFKDMNGRPVLYMPTDVYLEWSKKDGAK